MKKKEKTVKEEREELSLAEILEVIVTPNEYIVRCIHGGRTVVVFPIEEYDNNKNTKRTIDGYRTNKVRFKNQKGEIISFKTD